MPKLYFIKENYVLQYLVQNTLLHKKTFENNVWIID
jgi:hypothetical protein